MEWKNLFKVISIILLVVLLVACSNTNIENTNISNQEIENLTRQTTREHNISDSQKSFYSQPPKNYANYIDYETAIQIGQMHNTILNQMLESGYSSVDELKDKMLLFDIDGMSYENKQFILESLIIDNSQDVENEIVNTLSTSATKVYQKIKEAVINCTDVNNAMLHLNVILKNDINTFSDGSVDKQIILTFFETTRHSLLYWSKIDDGGLGNGDKFYANSTKDMQRQRIDWRKIAIADGSGAAGTLLRTWYLAGCGPLSWGAIVGAIGWGAVWSSGTVVLLQLLD